MKTRMLGHTGVAVSRVALGCGNFGGVGSPRHLIGRGLNREASMACMDEALALGINLFDTAHSYADGASERCIGEWLQLQSDAARAAIRIATKVGNVVTDTAVSVDLSPRSIVEQLSDSLTRLGLSRVDFCLSHAPDAATPIESTLEGFADLIERGLVSHIGACNLGADQLVAAMETSARLGLPRYEWVQNEYNLLNRADEQELLRLCDVFGIGYTPFSPMAGGLLSGKYLRNEPPPRDSRLSLRPEGNPLSPSFFEGIAQLEREARRCGCDTGALALAWVISHAQVTAAICGPSRRAEHLGLARQALTIELDESAITKIGSWFERTESDPPPKAVG
jgi:aryl-alcohol dehydrogenase-like predicted oxidoreductase